MSRHLQRKRASIFQILETLHELPPLEPAEPDDAEMGRMRAEVEAGDDDGEPC
jgi:hypothetical protein